MNPSAPRLLCSVEEYADEVARLVEPDTRTEEVGIDDADGRVLAADVRSGVSIPAFDNSAMDGYAVRSADVVKVPLRLPVVGEVPAGSGFDPLIAPGSCVRIMTGAPLPTDADAVVPIEDTDQGTDLVEIFLAPRPGAHVRRAGEDLTAGALVARAGAPLAPGLVGAVAAAGHIAVPVRPRPVVAVAATGDELVHDGSALGRGQIHESNARVLAAALRRDGAAPLTGVPVADTAAAVTAWLDTHAGSCDFLVLTGGASVGAYDVARDVLGSVGGVFRHVSMQPGKPQGWAVWKETPVIALPGNPVSAVISYQVFVRPLLDLILGRETPPWVPAIAGSDWSSPAGRRQIIPVTATVDPVGRVVVEPAHGGGSGSHLVSALGVATALARVPEQATRVNRGDLLEMQALA
ncbi:MAG: gephyrin-like molybdotransferase Glp [Propioniciclava sp.]